MRRSIRSASLPVLPAPSPWRLEPSSAGRYHLYVSLACPWAHRTLILRKLKGLESLVDVSVVSWLMLLPGQEFEQFKVLKAFFANGPSAMIEGDADTEKGPGDDGPGPRPTGPRRQS